MNEVFFISNNFLNKLEIALDKVKIKNVKGCKVALKVHMGEYGNLNYIRPPIVGKIVEIIKKFGGKPFLFDSPTLYPGLRSTPEKYLETAKKNGFTEETMGCPIIVSDKGFEEKTNGPLGSVEIAKDLKTDAIVVISHVKGHIEAGIGGAIKNLGMGGVTRKGKGVIHAQSRPIVIGRCNACGLCITACGEGSISLEDGEIIFNYSKCFGCGKCITVCPTKALKARKDDFKVLLTEGAYAVLKNFKKDKQFFVNVLMDISNFCDCYNMGGTDPGFPFCPDIGILVSNDAIGIDAASIDLIEKKTEKDIIQKIHHVDPRVVLDAGQKFGIGNKKYELKEF
jgi:hypothetical protein